MAFSKPASTSVVLASADSHGITMLRESLHYFRAALCQFRVCHDLCATSNLLHEDSVMKLDQCATEFRRLSTSVATLAEKVGSVWCRKCLLFYRNIEKVKGNPANVLHKISAQSKELSDGFKEVVNMSATLADEFGAVRAREETTQQEITKQFEDAKQQLKEQGENVHKSIITEAQEPTEPTTKVQESTGPTTGVIDAEDSVKLMENARVPTIGGPVPKEPVMKQVVGTFESHRQKASEEQKKAEEAFERAQIQTQSFDANAKQLRWWAKKTHQFPPLQILFPNVHALAAVADSELLDAQAHEQNAKAKLQEAQRELEKKTDQVEKAKVLASQLTSLMVALGQVKLIYDIIQAFWSSQEEYYGNLSKKVDSLKELQKYPDFSNEAAQQKAKWLSDEKDLLEHFHRALTVVNSSYNFYTKLPLDESTPQPCPIKNS